MPELIVVRSFSQPHEAHLACSALRAAGLYARVADANVGAANWLYSNAVGGVKVLVGAEDADTASEVLDRSAAVQGDPYEGSDNDMSAIACPRCGSTDVGRVQRGRRLAALT
jgi:hypothetical protein